MWAMTSFGILMPSIRPPSTVPEGDDKVLQVRTRRARDLEILRDEYMGDDLGPIMHTPEMDYEYRAYCTHEAFGEAMKKIVMAIDFEKFKPTTEDKYKDKDLHSVYNSIWSTVISRLSTRKHQIEYWTRVTPARSKHRPLPGTGRLGKWWEEAGEDRPWYERDEYRDLFSQDQNGDPSWGTNVETWDPEVEDLDLILSEFDQANEAVLADLAGLDYGDSNGRKPKTKRQKKRSNRR